ncbi:MAG: transglycosylase SLT domain-containing protein [Minwuia sp.]|nr:transglycosylase SLT domain-containing protein [Minwuia sp.]
MKQRIHTPFRCLPGLLIGIFTVAIAASASGKPVESIDLSSTCRNAALAAERRHNIPSGLLAAVARVESGRAIAAGRDISAWPWTIHSEGRGRYHDTKAAAIAEVEGLKSKGVRNIDIGCMQVNMRYHPDAFENLESAFDPDTNAEYAATFVKRLFAETRSWSRAISFYHSRTPKLANAYRKRVMAAWSGERQHAVNQIRETRAAARDARRQAAKNRPRLRALKTQARTLGIRKSPYISLRPGQPRIRTY